MMRYRFAIVAVIACFTVFAPSDVGANEPSVSSELSSERRKEVVAQIKEILEQTTIARKGTLPVKAELVPQPVLYWDDVPRGHHYGTLWICGAKGRPAAIVEMFTVNFAKEIGVWAGNVLHSLALEPVEGKAQFGWDWNPTDPGFVPKLLEDAPAPSKTKKGRELQMRSLARRFSAEQVWEGDREQLRLLTTPDWQYESADDGVSSGSLFVFTHGGTNPEIVLILEAIGDKEHERWSFGCVRLGHAEMDVTFDDRKVWHMPLYNEVNPMSPYYWMERP